MPLEQVWWNGAGGEDIHVLRGRSGPDLRTRLALKQVGAPNGVFANALPAGVAVAFAGRFAGAPAAHGVSVAAATGVVTAAAAAPPLPIRNFTVEATVSEGAQIMRAQVRVHVHGSVTDVWLSPGVLTVHQNATGVRLSVMARFDDGVIGDITDWSSLPAGHLDRLQWLATTPVSVNVGADGTIAPLLIGGPQVVRVGVGAPPLLAARSAAANISVVAPWNTATSLTYVAGPGPATFGQFPNLLFLPDGFTDQAGFEKYVRQVVAKMTSRRVTRPFDLLAGRFNYWSAWVPSVESGISVRSELGAVVRSSGAVRQQSEVPFAAAPPAGAASWTLPQLIHEVGLPVPGDAGRPLTGGPNAMLADWQVWFGAGVTAALVPADVYTDWLALHERTFVDDRDTAFRGHLGTRPTVFPGRLAHRTPSIRVESADFDAFLNNLGIPVVGNVGVAWGGGAGGPANLTPGKDRGLICVLANSRRRGGSNFGVHFGATTGVQAELAVRAAPLPSRAHAIDPPAFPTAPVLETIGRVAHELAHSLTLLDEYGGGGTAPAATTFPNDANIQEESAVRVGGNIVAANIKWRWHRIAHAGVTAGPLVPMGALFRVDLQPGHGKGFAPGQVIRLRSRPLLTATVSDELEITALAVDAVELRDPSGTLLPATFPPGSVFMRTVRSTAAPHNELRLVAPQIEAHLNGQPHPLNAPRVPPAGRVCTPDNSDMLPATFIPGALRAAYNTGGPPFSAWLVGLYEGGGTYDCGVFHPTGTCLMRQLEIQTRLGMLYQFCTVCRYALVDLFDPRLHGIMDQDYAPRYPAQ